MDNRCDRVDRPSKTGSWVGARCDMVDRYQPSKNGRTSRPAAGWTPTVTGLKDERLPAAGWIPPAQGGRMGEPCDRQPVGTAVTGRTGILKPAAGSTQLRAADQKVRGSSFRLYYATCLSKVLTEAGWSCSQAHQLASTSPHDSAPSSFLALAV